MLDLVCGRASGEDKAVRSALKAAIEESRRISVACRIREKQKKTLNVPLNLGYAVLLELIRFTVVRGRWSGAVPAVLGYLHITPLFDGADECVVYVAMYVSSHLLASSSSL